jgi:hypothetical protein
MSVWAPPPARHYSCARFHHEGTKNTKVHEATFKVARQLVVNSTPPKFAARVDPTGVQFNQGLSFVLLRGLRAFVVKARGMRAVMDGGARQH